MASHAVCPLCGKSSAIDSFPSGPGNDLLIQSVVGLGRGKGFAVVDRASALDNGELCGRLKPRVLELVSVLIEHGHLGTWELPTGPSPFPKAPGGLGEEPTVVPKKAAIVPESRGARSNLDRLVILRQIEEIIDLQRKLKRSMQFAKDLPRLLGGIANRTIADQRSACLQLAALLGEEIGRFSLLCSAFDGLTSAVLSEIKKGGYGPLDRPAVERIAVATLHSLERVGAIPELGSSPRSASATVNPPLKTPSPRPPADVRGEAGASLVPAPEVPPVAGQASPATEVREDQRLAHVSPERPKPAAQSGPKLTLDALLERASQAISVLSDPVAERVADSMRGIVASPSRPVQKLPKRRAPGGAATRHRGSRKRRRNPGA